ncbi:hypothetical protein V5P93_000356 [Actinokineospora auranticolor]|uniref:Uncharacterized protein n=1 Tax=Actinokineospora auranticolor TaxID=155976 RepID=A0A2S6GKM2_9PSEU|nr:hypothetical protein [Actinokineospora auranticolor]PPK65755.1 hypothetical protein CLV40_11214 [Actinokineospora auranticolor]
MAKNNRNSNYDEYDPEQDPMFAGMIRGARACYQREMADLHERWGRSVESGESVTDDSSGTGR